MNANQEAESIEADEQNGEGVPVLIVVTEVAASFDVW